MIRYCFICLFIFFTSNIYCQSDTIFKENQKTEFIFKYNETHGEDDKISNYFIEEISKSIPKILAYTKYTFSLNQFAYITKKITNNGTISLIKLHVNANSLNVVNGSDTKYKSIDISDYLLPTFLDFTIDIYSDNGILISSFSAKKTEYKNANFVMEPIVLQDSVLSKIKKISFSNVKLYYNQNARQQFESRIKFINDYYSSEFLIGKATEKIQNINTENIDMLKVYDINLDEVETIIAEIDAKKYPEKLNLKANDPILFVPKFEALLVEAKKMRVILDQMMANFDKVLYNKGIDYLSKFDTVKAIEYFQKSATTNPYYSPANYQLARIYLYQNKLEESGKIINSISSKMNPDQNTLKLVIILAKDLYKAYLISSLDLIKAEDYHKAIALLQNAKDFCANVTVMNCDEWVQKYMSQARYGIYNSFLIVSQKALEKEIFDLAEVYTLKARAYQMENSTDIISCSEANNLLKQLSNAYLKKGLFFNTAQRFDTALVMLQKAKQLCADYQIENCSDKIETGITTAIKGTYMLYIKKAASYNLLGDVDNAELMIAKAKSFQLENSTNIKDCSSADSMMVIVKTSRYYKNIADGRNYLSTSLSSKALDKFIEARELEKTYKVIKDIQLDSLIRIAAKPYIIALLEKASVKVWGNEIHKANTIADSAASLQALYLLKADSTLNTEFNKLNVLIFNKTCSNAKESYNENYRNAYSSIKNKEFNMAVDYFNACIDTVSKYEKCKFSDSTAVAGKNKYLNASEYQNLLKKSISFSKDAKYKEAIEKYIEAGQYFDTKNIAAFSIDHLSFQKHISFQKDNNYIYFCSKYFLNLDKYQDALFYLDLLRIKGYPSNYTIDIQEKLAQKLSEIDFATNPSLKPAKAAQNNIGSDIYYKYFRKAYLANWKSLKKSKSILNKK